MAHWIQRILLTVSLIGFLNFIALPTSAENASLESSMSSLDNEQFELGITAGVINIQDFGSEIIAGINANFIASEDVFMQMTFLQADAELSSYEKSQGQLFANDDRTFKQLGFLVGYNLFQGEQFFSQPDAQLSSLYLVAGIGDTDFGGEESFTYILGVGYQVGLSRRVNLKFDYRNYIYDSSLLREDEATQNGQLSASLNWLF